MNPITNEYKFAGHFGKIKGKDPNFIGSHVKMSWQSCNPMLKKQHGGLS
jgi:hypothetical protein